MFLNRVIKIRRVYLKFWCIIRVCFVFFVWFAFFSICVSGFVFFILYVVELGNFKIDISLFYFVKKVFFGKKEFFRDEREILLCDEFFFIKVWYVVFSKFMIEIVVRLNDVN